jgi:ribosome-associated protein
MPRLQVDHNWIIPAADLQLSHLRSSGPGGQNVNKVATKVELRFKLRRCAALSAAQKRRLTQAFPSHVSQGGDFIVTADRFRSQSRNLRDALLRLAEMIRSIRRPPQPRIRTQVTRAATRRRVEDKRRRGELKRQRKAQESD